MTGLQIPGTASGPWPAPAKLNLFLQITGQREDGYHTLQTVFQFLDRADRLYFDITEDKGIRRFGGPVDVPAAADLCVRAARLLQTVTGNSKGVDIYNDKLLPGGGGLGGGSSDAATTLWALNRLWNAGLDAGELARLGLELGADVPVFIHGEAAWAEGIGEILTPVTLDEPWYLVVVPPVSVSTVDIFSDTELTRDTPRMTIRAFLSGGGQNDCEAVVRRRHPEVAAAIDWLSAHAPARMTGTGACVFAAFGSEAEARSVERQLPRGWTAFVARGMNRSPLQAITL
ncbi:MAG: 4-(cytidine 5'-diphospho)-2-C-methyl-D-erythritol kinase [Gammaproteobacteria bacterium]|nr:4-(cytidine 5'-diphospho)-2-C-methyl-D-erythritol kinase [Gammaproteobacteria bacterium]